MFLRLIYSCPPSTPIPALRAEAGMMSMEHRVMLEKVCLVSSILHHGAEDSYCKEILTEQMEQGWGGLESEVPLHMREGGAAQRT